MHRVLLQLKAEISKTSVYANRRDRKYKVTIRCANHHEYKIQSLTNASR